MAVISKHLFYEKIPESALCHGLMHPETSSCLEGNWRFFPHYSKGILYFYLPIYLFKVLLEYKKHDRKYFKEILRAYCCSHLYGTAIGLLTIGSVCFLCQLSGRLHYYNVGAFPGFIAGASILFEQKENQYFNALIWMSMAVEALLNDVNYSKVLEMTKFNKTVLFMVINSLLMYLMVTLGKRKIPSNIWFYKPEIKQRVDFSRIMKVTCKYFCIGYALNVARTLLPSLVNVIKHPATLPKKLFNKGNFKLGLFFGTYVGVFETISFFLQNFSISLEYNSIISGLLAGVTFRIQPTLNILAIAIVTVLQMIVKKHVKIPERLRKIPFIPLLYALSNSFLFHHRILAMPNCPKYYSNMFLIAANGQLDAIHSKLLTKYFS